MNARRPGSGCLQHAKASALALLLSCSALACTNATPHSESSAQKRAAQRAGSLHEQVLASPFNSHELQTKAAPAPHSFLVAGHLYGKPGMPAANAPASTLLQALPTLRASGAEFFISLGDAMKNCSPAAVKRLRSAFTEQLGMPFFNAVGNHDLRTRERYLQSFPGPTWFAFRHAGVLHLLLDTELDVGRISGAQLDMLQRELQRAASDASIQSVAIYGHKLIFTDGNSQLANLHQRVNNLTGYQTGGAFQRDVLPALQGVAAHKQVIWFAGDVGAGKSLPLFYHKEPNYDLTWIATGLGDRPDDVLLQVFVDERGKLQVQVLRSDGRAGKPLESHGLEHWQQNA